MSRHLLKNLDRLGEIMGERRISLFLDYDGTLTPIVARPERAALSYQMREILKGLSKAYPTAIISGRGLADVRKRVGIDRLTYAGNHGTEIWSAEYTMVFDAGASYKKELERLVPGLEALSNAHRGVIMEHKGQSITMHYRLLDARSAKIFAEQYAKVVEKAAAGGAVRLAESKKAFEIRPSADWNKGRAVDWLLQRKPFTGTCPIYIGDDETDKDGYAAIAGRGVSVHVGSEIKEADYYLVAQTEVRTLLKWLCNHPVPRGSLFGNF